MKKEAALSTEIVDLLFPARCVCCERFLERGEVICRSCYDCLPVITSPVCRCCGLVFDGKVGKGHLCGRCLLKRPVISSVMSITLYREPVKRALQRLKYYGDTTTLALIRICMERAPIVLPEPIDYIIPVPLHIKRLRARGFNQSLLLSQVIFSEQKHKIRPEMLQKCQNTISQTVLSKKERQKNVRNSFKVRSPADIRDKCICLVDDVYTTGATLEECAKMIVKSGAKSVYAVVASRAFVG